MVRYKVRPWRDKEELLGVRSKIYLPNTAESLPARRDACDMIEVWGRRLPLPHAISSTRLLVEAQLHQLSSPASSTTVTCAVLATAVARFVTGFCDINQTSAVKRSMFDVAADLGLSEQWVELRHQTTHGGEMPALPVLETAVSGALDWLWESFWSRLDVSGREDQVNETQQPVGNIKDSSNRLATKSLLKAYVSTRKAEITSQSKNAAGSSSQAAGNTALKLSEAQNGQDNPVDMLQGLLVGDGMVFPGRREVGGSLTGAFALWDPLLILLSSRLQGFLVALALSMLDVLTQLSGTDEAQDQVKEAFALWLEHIFNSKAWSTRRSISVDQLSGLKQEVLRACTLSPGHWTQRLAQSILRKGSSQLRDDWRDVCGAASIEDLSLAQVSEDGVEGADITIVGAERTDRLGTSSHLEASSGWSEYPGAWERVPIGVAQPRA